MQQAKRGEMNDCHIPMGLIETVWPECVMWVEGVWVAVYMIDTNRSAVHYVLQTGCVHLGDDVVIQEPVLNSFLQTRLWFCCRNGFWHLWYSLRRSFCDIHQCWSLCCIECWKCKKILSVSYYREGAFYIHKAVGSLAVIVFCCSRLSVLRCRGLLAVFSFSLVSSIFSLKVSLCINCWCVLCRTCTFTSQCSIFGEQVLVSHCLMVLQVKKLWWQCWALLVLPTKVIPYFSYLKVKGLDTC